MDAKAGVPTGQSRMSRLRPSVGAGLRRWGVTGAALVVLVVGWWRDSSAPYLLGLGLLVLSTIVVLRRRVQVAAATALVLLLGGIGGPWLAVQAAYRPVGTPVSLSERFTSMRYVPSDDDLTRMLAGGVVYALDADGDQAWVAPLELRSVTAAWSLPRERTLVKARYRDAVLDDRGQIAWSRPHVEDAQVVAIAGDVVVERVCERAESVPSPCRWDGIDTSNGSTAWSVTGRHPRGFRAGSGTGSTSDALPASTTSLFLRSPDGSGEKVVHDGTTGAEVQRIDAGQTAWLTGDAVLVLGGGGGSCTIELFRAAVSAWRSTVDCAVQDALADQIIDDISGFVTGEALWTNAVDDGMAVVVDLRDGTVRAGGGYRQLAAHTGGNPGGTTVVGASVQVVSGRDAVVVSDAATGEELWRVGLPSSRLRTVYAGGDFVVVDEYQAGPLLLHKWFAPREPWTLSAVVYEARTGDVLGRIRRDYTSSDTIKMAGDRVLVLALDRHGESEWRMLKARA